MPKHYVLPSASRQRREFDQKNIDTKRFGFYNHI